MKQRSPGNFLSKNVDQRVSDDLTVTPLFFRTADAPQKQALEQLLSAKPWIRISDSIRHQLTELIKLRNPARTFSVQELEKAYEAEYGAANLPEYGAWVYYPWLEKLVHITDEAEFTELRTSRNKYKITGKEATLLAQKRIGVIGLSVGQSVCLTLAMERCFGELRIADFDTLDITNLNRLRSGVHNLGLRKTVLVAREIAEIDPFLKVTCFHEGITEDNLEDFLLAGGKLDVLIDECDSVDIKIQCRLSARKHHIPVVMEASDRGTIDIERFDLEPQRPILHGYVDHLDLGKLKDLTTSEEKVPYILPIAGVETLSARMKASAIEIGQTITTWPQLASAVTFGGGLTADVCRRILLGQYHRSGRYFVDIEELIGEPKKERQAMADDLPPLDAAQMAAIAAAIPDKDIPGPGPVPETVLRQLVHAVRIAPSAGNNQPWKCYYDGSRLWLFHELRRTRSFGDFRNMATYLSLGAALENLELKARALGFTPVMQYFPGGAPNPVAVISFQEGKASVADDLSLFLEKRNTNRTRPPVQRPIGAGVLEQIRNAVKAVENADICFIDHREGLHEIADIAGKADKLRVFIPEGHHELFERELRWTPEEARRTADGLDLESFDLSLSEKIGLRLARDPRVVQYLEAWQAGSALEKMTRESIAQSSCTGLITMKDFSPCLTLEAGRAVERAWLTAAKHDIAVQPFLATILHFVRLNYGNGAGMPESIQQQFAELQQRFNMLFNLTEDRVAFFMFRMFLTDTVPVQSYRLDTGEIFFQKDFAR